MQRLEEPLQVEPGAAGPTALYGVSPANVRRGFLRKVVLTVAFQLVIIVGFGSLFVYLMDRLLEPDMAPGDSPIVMGLLMFSAVIAILGGIFVICCQNMLYRFPTNHLFLGFFSVAEAILVSFLFSKGSVVVALIVTCVLVTMCTAVLRASF
mmetsp:Transcript_102372/g.275203  ORF Transcript_102372/g.275203 Transcript_102372/m.275203 type:complete len:152 (-) Transcript_102372:114-569(-)